MAIEPQNEGFGREKDVHDTNRRTHNKVMLISSLAHFDSFLNNATKLVLCMNPNEALKDYTIPVSTLLSKSRLDTLNTYILKKAAAMSRETFSTRLEFVRTMTKQNFLYLNLRKLPSKD